MSNKPREVTLKSRVKDKSAGMILKSKPINNQTKRIKTVKRIHQSHTIHKNPGEMILTLNEESPAIEKKPKRGYIITSVTS